MHPNNPKRINLLNDRPMSISSTQYWILAFFLLALFAFGGASRTDAQSLAILRPLSVAICALACITLRREHLAGRGWLLGSSLGLLILALVHVIPLPPSIWQLLPGRQDLVEVEKLLDISGIWRPLTISPANGWHAVLSLFAPLAIVLLGIQLSRDDLFRLLPLVISLAVLSGFIGLLQVIGDPRGPLYFYRITNNGSAVGLFANRNHAATLLACLLPLLAVYASTARGEANAVRIRQLAAGAIAIVLVPLILVTGSRSGLANAVVGLAAAVVLYRQPAEVRIVRRGKTSRIQALPILGCVSILTLALLTYFLSRAEAIERLFADISDTDLRTNFWTVSSNLFWKYFPWGSGSGSFVDAYQIIEPAYLLDATYLNRAHNDWVEIAVTFGLAGVIGLALGSAAFVWRSYKVWKSPDVGQRHIDFGRLASVCIAIIAIASISDYPLRTPTMMGLFAIFTLWFTESGRERANSASVDRGGM